MITKFEKTGCCERRGMVQIRVSFFLEPDEEGYDDYHIQVPTERYSGPRKERGQPADLEDFATWKETCEKKWIDTPCHNHFFRIEPGGAEDDDAIILDIAERCGEEVLRAQKHHRAPNLANPKTPRLSNVTSKRRTQCNNRVATLPTDDIRVR